MQFYKELVQHFCAKNQQTHYERKTLKYATLKYVLLYSAHKSDTIHQGRLIVAYLEGFYEVLYLKSANIDYNRSSSFLYLVIKKIILKSVIAYTWTFFIYQLQFIRFSPLFYNKNKNLIFWTTVDGRNLPWRLNLLFILRLHLFSTDVFVALI